MRHDYHNSTQGKRAAVYARFSSDMQKERSITDQFSDLEKAAQRFGFTINRSHYFSDHAVSASSLFERPGLTRDLVGAMERHEFDVVLVEATDRLSRRQADLFYLADQLKFHNVQIFTPMGEVSDMQLTFDGHTNADFIKKLSARVKRGHDGIAREGLIAGSLAYGYDTILGKPGERVINEKEAAVVLRIFTEYAEGKTPRQIVDGFAKEGIPSPTGAPFWSHQAIVGGEFKGSILRNRLYIGEYNKNKRTTVKNPGTGKRVCREGDPADLISVKVPHLRIVPDDIWNAAHAVREMRGRDNKSSTTKRALTRKEYLLSGLVRCAECMGDMTVMFADNKGRGPRVSCSNALNKKTCAHKKSYWLDELTKGAIKEMADTLTDPEFLKARAKAKAEESAHLSQTEDADRKSAQAALDRLNVQIKRIAVAIANSVDDPIEELGEQIKQKEAERVAVKERLRLLGSGSNVVVLSPATIAAFAKSIDALRAQLLTGNVDAPARHALQNVLDCVLVHPTPKRASYQISLYARLSAVSEGIQLFPAMRTTQQVVEEEGFPHNVGGGNTSSRPRSSRHFTGL